MRDREIVAAIVKGDPAGLAAAYDQYAQGLYDYCRSLLSEPADAADAVQDTFIVASAKVSGLREPDRLRAWPPPPSRTLSACPVTRRTPWPRGPVHSSRRRSGYCWWPAPGVSSARIWLASWRAGTGS